MSYIHAINVYLEYKCSDFGKPRINFGQHVCKVSAKLMLQPKRFSRQCLVCVGVVLDEVPRRNHDEVVARVQQRVTVRLYELKRD